MDIGPLNVLCIDDNESDYLLIEHALRTGGMLGQCERVQTVQELNAALEGNCWDLVLSDYAVPGMYFTDTLRRFVRQYPNLPLILVSGTIGEVKASVMVKAGTTCSRTNWDCSYRRSGVRSSGRLPAAVRQPRAHDPTPRSRKLIPQTTATTARAS